MKNILLSLAFISLISCGTTGSKSKNIMTNFNEKTAEKVTLLAKVTTTAESADICKSELLALIDPTRSEEGCEYYKLLEDTENAGVFYFYEVWSSAEALENHSKSAHLTRFAGLKATGVFSSLDITRWERNDSPIVDITAKDGLVLFAKFTPKAGKEELLQSSLEALLEKTRAEEGCLNYDLNMSTESKGVALFYETWATVPHWDAHMKMPHIVDILSKLDTLVEGDLDLIKAKLVK